MTMMMMIYPCTQATSVTLTRDEMDIVVAKLPLAGASFQKQAT